MLNLNDVLACPRCAGLLTQVDATLKCAGCQAAFAIERGIPRMTDGAEQRDERMLAEWEAQAHARSLYTDRASILNCWEVQVLPQLVDWLGAVRGPILDVGCGVGHLGTSLTAVGRSDLELIGADFQRELLSEVGAGYLGLIEADVHHLPIKTGVFGAAIASNSLHHFPDPVRAMVEIARVLRPGGVFVAYDPRFIAPLELVKKRLRHNDKAFAEDYKAFRIDEYRELLGSSGLQVTDVRCVDPLGPLLATGLDYFGVGRLGLAEGLARGLIAFDRLLAGRKEQTPLGLMLAGRAVKQTAE